ncbi:MAG: NAD(P)/FAD-dependent oxidoreductase [Firmicutes bacterium]|nr:NAD(P)/FAD-dependent oxidoreductase [Bacillota bacterium]
MEQLARVRKSLIAKGFRQLEVRENRGALVLEGIVDSWQQYIAAGYTVVGYGFRGVVNNLSVKGLTPAPMTLPTLQDQVLTGEAVDVAIVGGGIIGCAVARELMRWNLSVAVLEKEDDVAKHTSSRNNGMVHPAMAVKLGSKKHHYNLRGNRAYKQVAAELGFELNWPGSAAVLEKSWHRLLAPLARIQAKQKGVQGVRMLGPGALRRLEPNVGAGQRGALLLPETGVVAPYKVTVAYAENAIQNGAQFFLNTVVLGFDMEAGRIVGVRTNRGTLRARLVINAAGVWADKVAALADDQYFSIHARKGVIAILDKKTGASQSMVFGRLALGSDSHTKGGGLTPLVKGNILAGPTATEVPHREDYSTSSEDMEFLFRRHLPLNRTLRPRDVITYFAGTRACTFEEDFIIEPSRDVTNLIHVAGIQSPGLASAPAIAEDVAEMAVDSLQKQMEVRPNTRFNPKRQGPPEPLKLSFPERNKLIATEPAYGRIVCRCELISEGEIIAALRSPLPATNLDALKRRVRAGMGRCQGGFCTPALIGIIAREVARDVTTITKREPGSELVAGLTKAGGESNAEQ